MGITLQVQHHIDGLFDETVALLHNRTTMSRDDAIEAATEAMSGAAVVALPRSCRSQRLTNSLHFCHTYRTQLKGNHHV